MYKYIIIILVLFGLSCSKQDQGQEQAHVADDRWVETTAEIINVGIFEGSTWMYSYQYEVEGREPIQQHTMVQGKKPVAGQKIKMKYRKDEPVIFELLEEVKFE